MRRPTSIYETLPLCKILLKSYYIKKYLLPLLYSNRTYMLQQLQLGPPPCFPQYMAPHRWTGNGETGPEWWQTVSPTRLHHGGPVAGSAASPLNTAVCVCVCMRGERVLVSVCEFVERDRMLLLHGE